VNEKFIYLAILNKWKQSESEISLTAAKNQTNSHVFCLSEAQLYGLCRSEINYMQGRRRAGEGIVDSFAFPKS
jgi:hypothetical protein